jgi:hypothetical protein
MTTPFRASASLRVRELGATLEQRSGHRAGTCQFVKSSTVQAGTRTRDPISGSPACSCQVGSNARAVVRCGLAVTPLAPNGSCRCRRDSYSVPLSIPAPTRYVFEHRAAHSEACASAARGAVSSACWRAPRRRCHRRHHAQLRPADPDSRRAASICHHLPHGAAHVR